MASALKAYLIVLDADDGRIVRLFNLERKAIQFVATEHSRRWDFDVDAFQQGQDLTDIALYHCTLDETVLLDEYSLLADADGDADGWQDEQRNAIAQTYQVLLQRKLPPEKRGRG